MGDPETTDGGSEKRPGPVMTDGGTPSLSRVLEALADQRRRYLCYYVMENERTNIEECAAAIAARDLNCPPADVPPEERERVEATLYHQHLPKLAELGIIDYDGRTGDVRCRHPPQYFEEVLQIIREIETDLPLVL